MFPRSNYPFYIVTYYVKWVTTSWTDSTLKHRVADPYPVVKMRSDPDPVSNIWSDPDPVLDIWSDQDPVFKTWSDPDPI